MLTRTTTAALTISALGATSVLTLGTDLSQASDPVPTATENPDRSPIPRNVQTMLLDIPFQGGHTKFIDHGHNGVGPGDLFLSTDIPVFAHGTHKKIGEIDATELVISNRHNGTATGPSTLRLPGGTLEGESVIRHTDHPSRSAVHGGTGRYLGVTGQVTLLREDTKHKVTVIRIELLH